MIYKCSIKAPESLEPLIEAILWGCEAQSVSTAPLGEQPRVVDAFFVDHAEHQVQAALQQGLESNLDQLNISWVSVGETDWVEQVKAGFVPIQAGKFRIVAEWEDVIVDEWTLRIRPGQAFGTGHHETTQMALEALSEADLSGSRVLDVGCGTGILALAAERLGAGYILGIDNDPDCAENMQDHLTLNRAERVELQIGTIDKIQSSDWDFVIANITLNVLVEVWPLIFQKLKSGGQLLTTGLLIEQAGIAKQVLTQLGFRLCDEKQSGEWLFLAVTKP